MKKKSLFQASFEESLNLEDDGFVQYQKKDVYGKLEKYYKRASFYRVKNSECYSGVDISNKFKFHAFSNFYLST